MRRKTTTTALGAACLALMLTAAASAETLYRCGVDGREFSQKPCTDGQRIDASPHAPSASEVAAARDVAARDAKLAKQLRRENEAHDARPAVKAGAIDGLHAPHPASSSASAPKGKKKKTHRKSSSAASAPDGDFRAVAPSAPSKDSKPKSP